MRWAAARTAAKNQTLPSSSIVVAPALMLGMFATIFDPMSLWTRELQNHRRFRHVHTLIGPPGELVLSAVAPQGLLSTLQGCVCASMHACMG